MITSIQRDIIQKIASICELSPDARFGQLLANISFLAEDMLDRTLWDIEDGELLGVLEKHHADLSKRTPNVA